MKTLAKSQLKLCAQTTVFGMVLMVAGFTIFGCLIVAASLALAFLEGYLET